MSDGRRSGEAIPLKIGSLRSQRGSLRSLEASLRSEALKAPCLAASDGQPSNDTWADSQGTAADTTRTLKSEMHTDGVLTDGS